MKLEQTNYDNGETGCCARLDTAMWDDKAFEWQDKRFLKDHIRALLHIPLNFGSVISRDHAAIQNAEAYPEQPIWLTDEVSPWGSDIYIAVDRDVPGAQIERLSGRYRTKVFEGPYRDAGKWHKAMEAHVSAKGEQVQQMFTFYATCPKCSKHYGKNQAVLFARVA